MSKKIFCCIIILFGLYSQAFCFDDKQTHPEITVKAISNSNLEIYLINNFGFTNGLDTKFPSDSTNPQNTVKEILKKGSTDEDREPSQCRASNHFHNPLIERWEYAGLSGYQGINAALIDAKCGILDSTWYQKLSNPLWATSFVYFHSPAPCGRG